MKPSILQNMLVLRRISRLFRGFLSGLFISCLVIRFLVRDSVGGLSVIYYSTPLPILALFSLILGIIWLPGKRKRSAKLYFVLALACVMAWSYESFSLNSRAPVPTSLKLFFWNAAGNKSTEEIANHIHSFNADLIGIVESGITPRAASTWSRIFSDHTVEVLANGMALITRGRILSKENGSLSRRGRYNLLEVVLDGEQFH